jgi:hypothetical protein
MIERQVVAVHHDRRSGVLVELGEAADVIDVRVGADDGFYGQLVAADEAEDAFYFVAGVDDDGFARFRIADDGAIALQHSDRDLDVNHFRMRGVRHSYGVVHARQYIIGVLAAFVGRCCIERITLALEIKAMCKNIKNLFNFDPPVTEEEVRVASLQFVRKISGFNKPSKANEGPFQAAIEEVAEVSMRLLRSLETTAPPKNREEEAMKAKARAAERFGD